jgi:hypothetical protein
MKDVAKKRHCDPSPDGALPIEYFRQVTDRDVRRHLDGNPRDIYLSAVAADGAFCAETLHDPSVTTSQARYAGVVAADLHTASHVLGSTSPDGTADIDIAGLGATLPGLGPTDVNLHTWFDLYWWKALSRDTDMAAATTLIDLPTLMGDGRWDPHRVHLYEALRARDDGDPAWVDHIAHALEALDRPILVFPEEGRLLHRGVIEILAAVAAQDHTQLTHAITAALKNHRKYWDKNNSRRDMTPGYTALPVAAACAMALDAGMTIDVESDYLPTGLIHPGWYPTTSG